MLLWPVYAHGVLTLDFSQYCNVLQVSAGGKKRKRKRVLKSKMFIDEEEGCMGKIPQWNWLHWRCVEDFYRPASPRLWKRFTKSLCYSPSTSCSQTEVTALLVKAWVGSHGAGAESLLFFDYSQISFQFFSLPSCQHEHLLRLLSFPKTQTFKDGAERGLGLRINSGWEKCGLFFFVFFSFSFGDRSRAVQQSLIIC